MSIKKWLKLLEVLPGLPGPRTLVVACDALAEEGMMFGEVSPFISLDVVMIFTVLKVVVAEEGLMFGEVSPFISLDVFMIFTVLKVVVAEEELMFDEVSPFFSLDVVIIFIVFKVAMVEEGPMFDKVSPFFSLDFVIIFTVLKVVVACTSSLKFDETRPELSTRVAELASVLCGALVVASFMFELSATRSVVVTRVVLGSTVRLEVTWKLCADLATNVVPGECGGVMVKELALLETEGLVDELCFILIHLVVEVWVATNAEELFVAHLKEVLEGVFDVFSSLAPMG